MKSGIIAVFKPKGWTSNDVTIKIRNILQNSLMINSTRSKVKVGHGGTLDPLAEGVLVLGIENGTKLLGEYLSGSKVYHATALLGYETDTLDSTGKVTEKVDCSHIKIDDIEKSLSLFRGEILQIPPMYSALKKDGVKLYELARKGVVVERKARSVHVYQLELLNKVILNDSPTFNLNIESSGGFYVRSLISDLARTCNGRAHMTELVRVKQGPFHITDCIQQHNWNFDAICDHIDVCNKLLAKTNN